MPKNDIAAAPSHARLFLVLGISSLLAATDARAEIVPLANWSVVYTKSVAGPVLVDDNQSAFGTGIWDGFAIALAEDGGTSCGSDVGLTVDMSPSCLQADGKARGQGAGAGTFHHEGYANLGMLFLVNVTQEYTADIGIIPGNLPAAPGNVVALYDINIRSSYWRLASGSNLIEGRIAPGSYRLLGRTSYLPTALGGESDYIFVNMCFTTSTTPLINGQPQHQTVTPGATIDMQITLNPTMSRPSGAGEAAVTTYQWRKDLQNLANGGRISGVNTSHLTIANAGAPDVAGYDCVVTQGTIVEPSSLAQLSVTGILDVELPLGATEVSLSAPRPNPSRAGTRFEFTLGLAAPVRLTVYDAQGRLVKDVVPPASLLPGRYGFDWDGKDASGARVASGLYFAHLVAGDKRLVQRAVVLSGGR